MSAPTLFRKKPDVVMAMQYTPESCRTIHAWIDYPHEDHDLDCDAGIYIDTLDGLMEIQVGDWVILTGAGLIYGCKSEDFEADYERV